MQEHFFFFFVKCWHNILSKFFLCLQMSSNIIPSGAIGDDHTKQTKQFWVLSLKYFGYHDSVWFLNSNRLQVRARRLGRLNMPSESLVINSFLSSFDRLNMPSESLVWTSRAKFRSALLWERGRGRGRESSYSCY